MRIILTLLAFLSLAACAPPALTPKIVAVNRVALAELKRVDGSDAGVATLSDRSDGVWLSVAGTGAVPGTYGIHLHAVGKCEAPDFASAGPHWNPAQKQHGFDNPMGTHAGDVRNLVVDAEGIGSTELQLVGALFEGLTGLFDADGIALVIHEKTDDYKTDPSGNSGKRVICGVFAE
jgi:superoxide dismutase, Cu-Zn family